jgi:hypothetical protein
VVLAFVYVAAASAGSLRYFRYLLLLKTFGELGSELLQEELVSLPGDFFFAYTPPVFALRAGFGERTSRLG